MKRLSKDQILALHRQLCDATGGGQGVRDDGLLDAAIDAPDAGFGGVEIYPSVAAKAARLAFGLVSNHPFVDGNKRIGVLAMLVTLRGNGVAVPTTDDDLITLGMGLAESRLTTEDVISWVERSSRLQDEGNNDE